MISGLRWCLRAAVALSCLASAMGASAQASPGAVLPRAGAESAVARGGVVFARNCVSCHGIHADGNGHAARLYNPRPANLRASDKNDAYLGRIIRGGGAALGRSQVMPAWGVELSGAQINDLVAYLRSINTAHQ